MRRRLLLSLLSLLSLLAVLPLPVGAADGPCPPGQTALGGTLTGQGDGLALRASVGIELTDARSRAYDVFSDGRVDTVGRPAGTRYSAFDDVNRGLAPGDAPTDRTWGAPGAAGPLCFTSNPRITHAFVEVYPRRAVDADGDGIAERWTTDRSRYGAAAHYRQPVPPGRATTAVALSLPRNTRSQTGSVAGTVTYRGRAVPVAAAGCGRAGGPPCEGITTVRAFPYAIDGPACGVEGFSASADELRPVAGRTWYAVHALAGGRCGVRTQSYSVRITCAQVCGGAVRTASPPRRPAVLSGAGTRADVSFG